MQKDYLQLQQLMVLLYKFKYILDITKNHPKEMVKENKELFEEVSIFCTANINILENMYYRLIFGELVFGEIEEFDKNVLNKMIVIKDIIQKMKYEK